MDLLFYRGAPVLRNHVTNMKCKQCNDAPVLAQKYSAVFKETHVNLECATHESYLKLISCVALYFLQPIGGDTDVYKHGDTSGFISVHWYCSNIVFASDKGPSCANKLCIHT